MLLVEKLQGTLESKKSLRKNAWHGTFTFYFLNDHKLKQVKSTFLDKSYSKQDCK